MDLTKLLSPFNPEVVSWRVGATNKDKTKGMALAYIDARDVMERLDEVCGPAGWQCEYPHAGDKTVCRIGLKVGDEWVWKSNGAGDTDHEAEKGALSDAFKRAAVCWGVGRYLYDLESPWVEIEAFGKSYKIKQTEFARLKRVAGGARTPGTSISERAAASVQQPAPLSTLAEDMIARLDGPTRMHELITLAKSPEWQADIDKLSEADKQSVRAAYGKTQRAIDQAEMAMVG